MKNLKCPNCGADITTNEAQNTGKCLYCNSRFATEQKTEQKEETTTASTIFNSTFSDPFGKPKKRPKLKVGLLLLFFFINPLILAGYIIITCIRQSAWDKDPNNNKE